MISDKAIAHVSDDKRVHLLHDHLMDTAERAASMASEFGCAGWGRLGGLWHDVGKYSQKFQEMIRSSSGLEAHIEKRTRVDHSTVGGILATEKFGGIGRAIAYLIAGHHAGLPDWESESSGMSGLAQRLQKKELLESAMSVIPNEIVDQQIPREKPPTGADPALWIRMLFSCIVDADFLDTEAFMDPDKATDRGRHLQLKDLIPAFMKYMSDKQEKAEQSSVNRLRSEIFRQCLQKAEDNPGIFTLTVPTGGGKTLASMGFALHHAVKRSKRRIIYVIPYTSIIEQTADQFRQIFGDAVVEHHSNLDVADETKETGRSRLACENWDAPIIVTTSVQFFESLFASRTSRCRKLHNIVNSVVVLDEAQLLPPEFLKPILSTLNDLQQHYGVTLLISTATQPAFKSCESGSFHFEGLSNVTEIMDDPISLHHSLKRVNVRVPDDLQKSRSWQDIAEELRQHPTVLCVVNRRDDCRTLHQLMSEGTIHLSALMCGAHRTEVISDIKKRLHDGIPTRVISTQLVEAGVDLDFPVVYRAIAGLDSIAQAAGRCNREGRMGKGDVRIFVPPSDIPRGHLRQAGELGKQILSEGGGDPLSPEHFERYFRELFWLKGEGLDKHGILQDLHHHGNLQINFRTAAGKFQIIDESTQATVLVRYGEGAKLIEQLIRTGPERWQMRKLQRHVVNLPRYIHSKLLNEGAIREIHPGIYVQGHDALYHPVWGFCVDKSIVHTPDELVG